MDPTCILATRRSCQEPDRYRDENHDRLIREDVPEDEMEAALHNDDVDEEEGVASDVTEICVLSARE